MNGHLHLWLVEDETERYFGQTPQNLKCQHTFGHYSMDFMLYVWGGVDMHEDLDIGVLIKAFFIKG